MHKCSLKVIVLLVANQNQKGGVLIYTGTGNYIDYMDSVRIIKAGIHFPENIPIGVDLNTDEFESYFERKPGSKAKHVTLLLLECFWQVENIILGDKFTSYAIRQE